MQGVSEPTLFLEADLSRENGVYPPHLEQKVAAGDARALSWRQVELAGGARRRMRSDVFFRVCRARLLSNPQPRSTYSHAQVGRSSWLAMLVHFRGRPAGRAGWYGGMRQAFELAGGTSSTFAMSIFLWPVDRLALQEILDDVSSKFVPPHVNIFSSFGGTVRTSFLPRSATAFCSKCAHICAGTHHACALFAYSQAVRPEVTACGRAVACIQFAGIDGCSDLGTFYLRKSPVDVQVGLSGGDSRTPVTICGTVAVVRVLSLVRFRGTAPAATNDTNIAGTPAIALNLFGWAHGGEASIFNFAHESNGGSGVAATNYVVAVGLMLVHISYGRFHEAP